MRGIVALNFQVLSDCLEDVRAFSLEFDGGNKSKQSYLDVRVRFEKSGKLNNIHLIVLSMHKRHTGEYQQFLITKLSDAINPEDWKFKLISMSTDGASAMTGKILEQ